MDNLLLKVFIEASRKVRISLSSDFIYIYIYVGITSFSEIYADYTPAVDLILLKSRIFM